MKKYIPLFFLFASLLRADPLFVSILEVDGYDSARQSVSRFARQTGMPSLRSEVDGFFAKRIPLPSLNWLAANKPIRFVTALDTAKPLSDANPSILAIVPMFDKGDRLLDATDTLYKKREKRGTHAYALRSPVSTNLVSELHVAFEGTHALICRSQDTLDWGWNVRARFIKAPLDTLPGTFRLLANAQRFAGLLPLFAPEIAKYEICADILKDFPTAFITLDVREQSAGIAVRGIPKTASSLGREEGFWSVPPKEFWQKVPQGPLFAAVSNSAPPTFSKYNIPEPYASLFAPLVPLLPESVFKGPAVSILTETDDGNGLCYFSCAEVSGDVRLEQAAARLAGADGAIKWTSLPPRKALGTTVYRFKAELAQKNKGAPDESSDVLLRMVLKFFLRKTTMETFVKDGRLVVTLGPDRPLAEEAWGKILQPTQNVRTFDKEVSFDPWFSSGDLVQGTRLTLSASLLKSFALIPGIRREQLDALPRTGDPGTFGITKAHDGTITLALRMPVSEIRSLHAFDTDARPLLQEIFFQLLVGQMEKEKAEK